MNKILHGDCLETIRTLPDNSIDSIVTDPPYELGFMGKSWDNTGIANSVELWKECLRVLKPGGHLLAFSGTRTYHRMACAIEDAGFEVRDMIEWVYGSGFPKSLNIGKAVDKLQGNEREVVGENQNIKGRNIRDIETLNVGAGAGNNTDITKGTSEWEGWGTALKPAHEPICMARKPLGEKTVAENVLKYGTGGINIDESRVKTSDILSIGSNNHKEASVFQTDNELKSNGQNSLGRFPANLIHDNSEEVRECFPESKSVASKRGGNVSSGEGRYEWNNGDKEDFNKDSAYECGFNDSGNASRFFKSIIYQAKASKSERNKGCEGLEEKDTKRYGDFEGTPEHAPELNVKNTNNHPTVKPTALMEYLIKMVSREGQTVLDPFGGSGTTGVACQNTNRNYILIEKEQEYIDIIKARLSDNE